MPIILKIEHENGQHTAVWEIKEDEATLLQIASLHDTDLHAFSIITNPERRLEWLAVRALLKEFHPNPPTINYHKNGKPFLENATDKISISHSGKIVGIALNASHSPGIDIEIIHPRILKIANRFLSELEKTYLGAQSCVESLIIMWGAKEVMFKVYEHGGVTFKDDLMVKPFTLSSQGQLEGVIYKDGIITPIPMEYRMIGDFILVQTNYAHRNFEKKSEL